MLQFATYFSESLSYELIRPPSAMLALAMMPRHVLMRPSFTRFEYSSPWAKMALSLHQVVQVYEAAVRIHPSQCECVDCMLQNSRGTSFRHLVTFHSLTLLV